MNDNRRRSHTTVVSWFKQLFKRSSRTQIPPVETLRFTPRTESCLTINRWTSNQATSPVEEVAFSGDEATSPDEEVTFPDVVDGVATDSIPFADDSVAINAYVSKNGSKNDLDTIQSCDNGLETFIGTMTDECCNSTGTVMDSDLTARDQVLSNEYILQEIMDNLDFKERTRIKIVSKLWYRCATKEPSFSNSFLDFIESNRIESVCQLLKIYSSSGLGSIKNLGPEVGQSENRSPEKSRSEQLNESGCHQGCGAQWLSFSELSQDVEQGEEALEFEVASNVTSDLDQKVTSNQLEVREVFGEEKSVGKFGPQKRNRRKVASEEKSGKVASERKNLHLEVINYYNNWLAHRWNSVSALDFKKLFLKYFPSADIRLKQVKGEGFVIALYDNDNEEVIEPRRDGFYVAVLGTELEISLLSFMRQRATRNGSHTDHQVTIPIIISNVNVSMIKVPKDRVSMIKVPKDRVSMIKVPKVRVSIGFKNMSLFMILMKKKPL